MTLDLKAERQAVADLLTEGGVRAVAYVPQNPTPPIAMVVPGSPYLTAREDFGGTRTLRLDVWLVIGTATSNASLTDTLDARIGEALAVLDDTTCHVEDVQVETWEPDSGGKFLVAVIGISTPLTP